jgi:dipeptidyl aminopeptidase/acylaminoacyl peptidase
VHLLLGLLFTLPQILGLPVPVALVAAPRGNAIAYALDERGVRSIWFTQAPGYQPRELWSSGNDDGQEISDLSISKDGRYLVYVRGGDHDANWSERPWPNPDLLPKETSMTVNALATNGGVPIVLGDGDAPVIKPDGKTVAFLHDPDRAVWSAPIDGSKPAKPLFFDRGKDGDLQWSPDGSALAFTSDRGDHSFVGIYRNDTTPLQFLAPSTVRDFSPVWSPNGASVAFLRIGGDGGPPQDPLKRYARPWQIWVADAATGNAHAAWRSGDGLRDSLTQIEGPQLHWVAGNRLTFVSEQTNWAHVYVVPAAGGPARLLTPGDFIVEDTSLSPDLRTIYYTANTGSSPGDDDRRHVFRVSVDGGAPVEVTSGDRSQWWPVATSGGVAYVEAGARTPMVIEYNARALSSVPADFPVKALVVPREVAFRAADGTLVHGQLFEPRGGAAKKPAVIFVHGGPPRQMLLTWHYMDYYTYAYAVNQYLASRGFVVLSVNYRLSIGYGEDFENPPHAGPAGASEYQDVLAGARHLQNDSAVDAARIGIWGGSYGGYLTALALARDSDIFKAGVDFHGVHDWTMFPQWFSRQPKRYQTYDEKRFLRVAWLSSPDAYISKWHSPVLLIQGDDDRNVPFHQTVDVAERLRLAHVPFDVLVIPNEIHGFLRWHSWVEADEATVQYLQQHLGR